MWGNCWEWTATPPAGAPSERLVKGGSWKAPRTDCRTEQREIRRPAAASADDLGFRVVREDR